MMNATKKTNIEETIKELREFTEMQNQIKAEIEALKVECIEYMTAEGIDEIVTDDGKVTYREVISNRFDTTAFKKKFLELYKAYVKQTTARRFTFN